MGGPSGYHRMPSGPLLSSDVSESSGEHGCSLPPLPVGCFQLPPTPCLMQVHISQQSLGVGSHSPPVTPSTTWPRFLRHQCVPHSTEMGGRIGTGRGAMTSDTLGDSMKTLFLEDALLIFSLAANYPFPHL